MEKRKKVAVTEIFGPTFEGEGVFVGKRSIFIRLFGCDSFCEKCDSMHAVDKDHPFAVRNWMSPEEITEQVEDIEARHNITNPIPIVLSGGNPVVWDLTELVSLLKRKKRRYVHVETQGTMFKEWLNDCDHVTISPKGPGMNDRRHGILSSEQLNNFIKKLDWVGICFKVVIFGDGDLDFAERLVEDFPQTAMYLSVGNNNVSSQNQSSVIWDIVRNYRDLWQKVIERPKLMNKANVTLLPQLHVIAFGNQTGV